MTTDGQPPAGQDQPEPLAVAHPAPAPSFIEARLTGTDGGRLLPFRQPVQRAPMSFAHVSKTAPGDTVTWEESAGQNPKISHEKPNGFAHVSKTAQLLSFSTLWGASATPVWRPRKFTRKADYPGVSATGFFFRRDSGGFALIRRAGGKYVAFYTKAAIQELEQQHGNQSSKTKRTAQRARTGGRGNG
ncbi:MAG: hypothetical protein U0X75_15970 [Acidobacteriota bacterium]